MSNILVNNNIPIILTNTIDSFLCRSIQTAANFRKTIRGRTQMFKKHGNMNNHLWFFLLSVFHYYVMAWVTFYVNILGWTTRKHFSYFTHIKFLQDLWNQKMYFHIKCWLRTPINQKICIKLGIIGNVLIEYSFNMSQKPIVVGR